MIRCWRRRVTVVLGSFIIILLFLQSSWFPTRGCSSINCNGGEQDQQIIDNEQQQQQQRLVIFAGPHKGASTSVESFFFSIFKEQQTIPKPFVNWSMPMLSEGFRGIPQLHQIRNNTRMHYESWVKMNS